MGSYLGKNWTQFPSEYSYMIGFLLMFVGLSVMFALITQGFYKPQPLFQKARFADEIIGGILGVIEAAIIFGAMLVILDSFFADPGPARQPQRAAVPARDLDGHRPDARPPRSSATRSSRRSSS